MEKARFDKVCVMLELEQASHEELSNQLQVEFDQLQGLQERIEELDTAYVLALAV